MTEIEAIQIAEEFAVKNAKCPYGKIVRVMLLVEDEDKIQRIDPKDANKYVGKKEWSVSFDLMRPKMIPRDLVVVIDYSTSEAHFFETL